MESMRCGRPKFDIETPKGYHCINNVSQPRSFVLIIFSADVLLTFACCQSHLTRWNYWEEKFVHDNNFIPAHLACLKSSGRTQSCDASLIPHRSPIYDNT